MDLDLLSRIALALGIGLLIGLERGWRAREADDGSRAAGIRTFAISGLMGGIVGAVVERLGGAESPGGGIAFGLAFIAYSAVIAAFSRDENRAEKTVSATTTIAGMLTFALGTYAMLGDVRIAAAAAVAAAVLLAIRETLHGWVETISWVELRSGLVLLTMTFIALPILPDDPIGPFGGVNPREVWLIAIVLAGVSFSGYAAVKHLGQRHGVLLAAAAGGLASSTAVTLATAQRARAGESSPRLLAGGAALASAISFLRVLAIVAAFKPGLLSLLAPALGSAAAVAGGFAVIAVYGAKRNAKGEPATGFRNPFDFWSVVGFAALLAATMVVARAASEVFGAAGAVLSAALVGLADVDSVAVSITHLGPETLAETSAVLAILTAAAANTLSKLAIGAGIGRGAFAVGLAVMSFGCLAVGGAVLWATFALIPAPETRALLLLLHHLGAGLGDGALVAVAELLIAVIDPPVLDLELEDVGLGLEGADGRVLAGEPPGHVDGEFLRRLEALAVAEIGRRHLAALGIDARLVLNVGRGLMDRQVPALGLGDGDRRRLGQGRGGGDQAGKGEIDTHKTSLARRADPGEGSPEALASNSGGASWRRRRTARPTSTPAFATPMPGRRSPGSSGSSASYDTSSTTAPTAASAMAR